MPVNVARLVDDNVLMGFEQGRPYLALSSLLWAEYEALVLRSNFFFVRHDDYPLPTGKASR